MNQVTHLAAGALNRSGDQLSIELHRPADSPSFVMVVWPVKPSITAPTPKALQRWRRQWSARWRRRRPNSPRRSGTADNRCHRALLPPEATDVGTQHKTEPRRILRGSCHPLWAGALAAPTFTVHYGCEPLARRRSLALIQRCRPSLPRTRPNHSRRSFTHQSSWPPTLAGIDPIQKRLPPELRRQPFLRSRSPKCSLSVVVGPGAELTNVLWIGKRAASSGQAKAVRRTKINDERPQD
jgi:hypothetical protein